MTFLPGSFRREGAQDFELSLAPIIDCFTVLITYLLVSASFLSLAVLEAGISVVSPSTQAVAAAPSLEVELTVHGSALVKLSGLSEGKLEPMAIPARAAGDWDFASLVDRLQTLLKDHPSIRELTLSADPMVSYKDVVRAVEALRKVVPRVFLEGQ